MGHNRISPIVTCEDSEYVPLLGRSCVHIYWCLSKYGQNQKIDWKKLYLLICNGIYDAVELVVARNCWADLLQVIDMSTIKAGNDILVAPLLKRSVLCSHYGVCLSVRPSKWLSVNTWRFYGGQSDFLSQGVTAVIHGNSEWGTYEDVPKAALESEGGDH